VVKLYQQPALSTGNKNPTFRDHVSSAGNGT